MGTSLAVPTVTMATLAMLGVAGGIDPLAAVTGSGGALVVLLFWVRASNKQAERNLQMYLAARKQLDEVPDKIMAFCEAERGVRERMTDEIAALAKASPRSERAGFYSMRGAGGGEG